MSAQHTIHHCHHGWDNSLAPVVRVAPGDSLEFDVMEASGGQLHESSTAADIERLDLTRVNPLAGPVFIDGAEPACFGRRARVPLKPFTGTIGVAPAEPGNHSVVPPRRVGGNMDVRDIALGTELFLPVEVAGALFSVGDTHAAQGDGEVCGTAIESPMRVALRFDLIKQQPLAYPRFKTPGPVSRHLDARGYDTTTGIGPDLMQAARDAVRSMVDLLMREQGMPAIDAYLLCSVCGDLRISEIVDVPHWTVSFYFPRVVFE